MSFTIIVNSREKWGEQINPTSYPKLFDLIKHSVIFFESLW